MLPNPVLNVDVATEVKRFVCGIDVSKSDSGTVFESLLSIATRVAVFSWISSYLRVLSIILVTRIYYQKVRDC